MATPQPPMLPPPQLTEGQIDRVASLEAKHAGDRARLDAKHENERRAMAADQHREHLQLHKEIGAELRAAAAAAAPVIPASNSTPVIPGSSRRKGARR